MPISDELKRVYASAPASPNYIETLELWHSAFPLGYFITNDVKPWRFAMEYGGLQEFQAVPFLAVQPAQDGNGNQDLQITIDNIGREAMGALEAASNLPQESIQVIFRIYLDRPDSLPQNDPVMKLTLSSVVVGAAQITGTATRSDTLNRLFPSEVYRLDKYPGLDR